MARNITKAKGRANNYTFIQLRHDVMRHENFKTLSGNATKLLIDLLSQYNGKNNGDFCAAWTLMKERGWKSKGTLHRALYELINRAWIIRTRQGGRHCASLYAVTWLNIDECDGKLDISPTLAPSNTWKIENGSPHRGYIGPVVIPIHQKQAVNHV